MVLFWTVIIFGAFFAICILMLKAIMSQVKTDIQNNIKSKEILDLIRQNGKPCPEVSFSTDVQPDFSGYFEQGDD